MTVKDIAEADQSLGLLAQHLTVRGEVGEEGRAALEVAAFDVCSGLLGRV
jgi:hypothetical protein